MVGVARMKRDNAERDLIEAEARLIQLRQAGAENKPEMSEQFEEAKRMMKDCEMMVDVTADELQKSVADICLNDIFYLKCVQLTCYGKSSAGTD